MAANRTPLTALKVFLTAIPETGHRYQPIPRYRLWWGNVVFAACWALYYTLLAATFVGCVVGIVWAIG